MNSQVPQPCHCGLFRLLNLQLNLIVWRLDFSCLALTETLHSAIWVCPAIIYVGVRAMFEVMLLNRHMEISFTIKTITFQKKIFYFSNHKWIYYIRLTHLFRYVVPDSRFLRMNTNAWMQMVWDRDASGISSNVINNSTGLFISPEFFKFV